MSSQKQIYKKVFFEISSIVNQHDPEELEPGEGNTPKDEYDQEVSRITAFAIHNQEEIKLCPDVLTREINSTWNHYFDHDCQFSKEITKDILKIII